MRISKRFNTRRLLIALVAGVISGGLYKLYLYAADRDQFNDSNLLISFVFVLVAAACIYLLLGLVSMFTSSRK